MTVRNPSVAGYFYPGTAAELKTALAKYVDKKAPKTDCVGLLAPHAGYVYSGATAGAAVSRVVMKDTVIIMGPTHSGLGAPFSVWPEGSWWTPLGGVDVDAELAEKIIGFSQYAEADYLAHGEEHAVEVQIPFLQYLKPDVRIVPMILAGASLAVYREIGHAIAQAIKETKRQVLIMASGDMTHYEPAERARAQDMKAIESMLKLDDAELTRRYNNLHITMCAHGPVTTLIAAAKELGATAGELIDYRNSGDGTGDYESVVAYAGVIFK
jgi:AmmeMemoRadiSam system protein B